MYFFGENGGKSSSILIAVAVGVPPCKMLQCDTSLQFSRSFLQHAPRVRALLRALGHSHRLM